MCRGCGDVGLGRVVLPVSVLLFFQTKAAKWKVFSENPNTWGIEPTLFPNPKDMVPPKQSTRHRISKRNQKHGWPYGDLRLTLDTEVCFGAKTQRRKAQRPEPDEVALVESAGYFPPVAPSGMPRLYLHCNTL